MNAVFVSDKQFTFIFAIKSCPTSGKSFEIPGLISRSFFSFFYQATVNVFGTKRCMFGSDWPVCNMHTTYERWVKTVEQSLSRFSEDEQSDVFTRNANRIYNIKV